MKEKLILKFVIKILIGGKIKRKLLLKFIKKKYFFELVRTNVNILNLERSVIIKGQAEMSILSGSFPLSGQSMD